MAKTKTNSGSELNANELGNELPAANFPADTTDNGDVNDTPEEKPKMRTLISGAEFWKFSKDEKGHVDGDIFEGYFVKPQIREKDGKEENQKAGSTIGYIFEQAGTGMQFIIGNSHSIEKALTAAGFVTDKLMRFVYLGQGKNGAGQKFNRFEIAIEE